MRSETKGSHLLFEGSLGIVQFLAGVRELLHAGDDSTFFLMKSIVVSEMKKMIFSFSFLQRSLARNKGSRQEVGLLGRLP